MTEVLSVGLGMDPTLEGFQSFVTMVMVPPSYFDATTSPYVVYAYDYAYQFCNMNLAFVPGKMGAWTLYAVAVYNLAADTLINIAMDSPSDPSYPVAGCTTTKYWQFLRDQYRINAFVPGVLTSTSDEGTSATYEVIGQFEGYTLSNLQQLKTPYGRRYLGIAGSWGTVWGLS